jgi:hypothetical protein
MNDPSIPPQVRLPGVRLAMVSAITVAAEGLPNDRCHSIRWNQPREQDRRKNPGPRTERVLFACSGRTEAQPAGGFADRASNVERRTINQFG